MKTYSFQTTDIERVRLLLEDRFHVKFVPHDSYHYGDYYLWKAAGPDKETFFRLRQNIEFEGELHYPELAENTVILDVEPTALEDELRLQLKSLGAKHLDEQDA